MPVSLTQEEYLKKLQAFWGTRWDYSRVRFQRLDYKIELGCSEHGWFLQGAKRALQGYGCRRCSRGVSLADFKRRAREHFGDFYGYEQVSFEKVDELVTVLCPSHGAFSVEARGHLRGVGCRNCGIERRSVSYEEFLRRARETHGELYLYSPEEWGAQHITITCLVHGPFRQNWFNHTKGNGCRACFVERNTLTEVEVGERLRELHGASYELVPGSFSKTSVPFKVRCGSHGESRAYAPNLLKGQELLCCSRVRQRSKMEEEFFAFVKNLAPEAIASDRTVLGGQELDVYLPERKIAFEFNGDYWHSDAVLLRTRGVTAEEYHGEKLRRAEAAGVKLYFVWEHEWSKDKSLVMKAVEKLL